MTDKYAPKFRTSRCLAKTLSVAGICFLASGCQTVQLLTDRCTSESILVSWPATITRNGSSTSVTLSGAVSPGNLDASRFNMLKRVLISGDPGLTTAVIWTVPAFEVNGGYVALMHRAPLASGQSEPVEVAFDGGGWGFSSTGRALPAAIAVRAENFNASSATGSVTAIASTPLRLRIDVTTRSATNETMRLTGEAQFRLEKVTSNCS
jgi:hypothetical protein